MEIRYGRSRNATRFSLEPPRLGAGLGVVNHMPTSRAFTPPRPEPLPAVIALMRCMIRGDGDLLSLLPAEAYRMPIGPLGYSRRSTIIVNRPDLVREHPSTQGQLLHRWLERITGEALAARQLEELLPRLQAGQGPGTTVLRAGWQLCWNRHTLWLNPPPAQ